MKNVRAAISGGGWLYAAALLAALWFIGAFVVLALMRAGFDFNLEWMEGLMLEQTRRVLEGRNLYAPPSADYVPGPYPPLYFYASAIFAFFFGADYLSLRLVSIVSTLASCAALYAFVRRESAHKTPGFLAAGLFCATWTIDAYWLDLGRVDMLSLALLLWAAYFVRFSENLKDDILAALLAAAAILTKQSAAIPIFALLFWLLAYKRRSLPFFGTGLLLFGSIALAVFYEIYGDWFLYYLWKVPASHGILDRRLGEFWRLDWLKPFGLATMCAVWYFTARSEKSAESPGGRAFYAIFTLACIATAFMGRIKAGGAYNALIPLHASISLTVGLSLAATLNDANNKRLRHFLLAVYLLQVLALAYNPTRFLPTPEMEQQMQKSLRTLSAIPGDTYVMRNPDLTYKLNKRNGAHSCSVEDMLKEPQLREVNTRAILEPFKRRAYDAIAVKPREIPEYCHDVMEENYEPTQRRISIILWQNDKDFTIDSEVVYFRKTGMEDRAAKKHK